MKVSLYLLIRVFILLPLLFLAIEIYFGRRIISLTKCVIVFFLPLLSGLWLCAGLLVPVLFGYKWSARVWIVNANIFMLFFSIALVLITSWRRPFGLVSASAMIAVWMVVGAIITAL